MARQTPENPEEQQVVSKDRDRQTNQPPGGFEPFDAIEVQRGDDQLLRGAGHRGNRQSDDKRNEQANQRHEITQVFHPQRFLILRRALPDVTRLRANGLAQVTHPVNPGVERNPQTNQTDGSTLLYGGVDSTFERGGKRRVADVDEDLIKDVLQ